jgi:hypothetical protein
VDVKRAADLYNQGNSLRQIGAELEGSLDRCEPSTSQRRYHHAYEAPPARPASTQQILELRDQGLTWAEVAKQVDMTVSGAWSRYRRPGSRSPHAWAGGSRCSPTPLTRTLHLASVQPSLIMSGRGRVASDAAVLR